MGDFTPFIRAALNEYVSALDTYCRRFREGVDGLGLPLGAGLPLRDSIQQAKRRVLEAAREVGRAVEAANNGATPDTTEAYEQVLDLLVVEEIPKRTVLARVADRIRCSHDPRDREVMVNESVPWVALALDLSEPDTRSHLEQLLSEAP